jgi:O-antigen/teichoic acid export membrane protein
MNPSQRIALNTAVTYARSVLAVGLNLFSARWVLNALGETDFGLFALVGSLITFVVVINTVMSTGASRYFAYSIGQDNPDEVNHWFNAALSIHLCLAGGLVVIGWPIGEYIVSHVLKIDPGRLSTCLWVYRISLISAFTSMASVPFVAMFTAKQHIAELSVWGMLQCVLTFVLAYILTIVSGDRLLIYTIGMVAITVLIQAVQISRAFAVFSECRIVYRQWWDKHRFMGILSFSSWNLIGTMAGTFRDQGSALILNLYFGPSLNAAYGFAGQVSGQANQLSAAMLGALSPEITASEGRGDRQRMISYSIRACKFGTGMIMIFAIPLMAEMDYILKLWLVNVPPYTAAFCQLILCTFLLDRLSAGYMIAVNAHGKIAGYQATIGGILLMTLPLAWLLLAMGYPPSSVGVAFVITMVACSFGRVLWARRLFAVPISRWLQAVVVPCAIVAGVAAIAALMPSWFMQPSFLRLTLATLASLAASASVGWFLALDADEREFFRHNMQNVLRKMGIKGRAPRKANQE